VEVKIITLLAALCIAVKIPLQLLAQMITGPLFVPGGAMAGGIYMWGVQILTVGGI